MLPKNFSNSTFKFDKKKFLSDFFFCVILVKRKVLIIRLEQELEVLL